MTKRLTTEVLTQEQLEAIRKRAEAAFNGPWHLEERWSGLTSVVGRYPFEIDGTFGVADCLRNQDAEFIAHAREDIPALLAEVERLQDVIERAYKQSGEIRGRYGDYLDNVTLKVDDILKVRRTLEEAIGE